MTPTEQDKELREEVYKHLEFLNSPKSDLGTEIDHIMKLITADRKRVELEARINELEIHQSHDRGLAGSIHMGRKDVDDRIAQLNKQKEQQ